MGARHFTGFPRGGQQFFGELSVRQDREWFKAHKEDYVRLWEGPMKALFEELKARLIAAYPGVAKTEAKHFRLYRDTRFSKDKSPFKTSISAALPLFGTGVGGLHEVSGLYAEFGKESFVALGRWMMEPDVLLRFRRAVADEKSGPPLAALVAKARKAGFEVSSHEALKRVPKPWAADHPRAELLKQKGLAVAFPPLDPALLGSPKLVETLVKQAAALAPLVAWLEKAVSGR